jgi:hypothetical protein
MFLNHNVSRDGSSRPQVKPTLLGLVDPSLETLWFINIWAMDGSKKQIPVIQHHHQGYLEMNYLICVTSENV